MSISNFFERIKKAAKVFNKMGENSVINVYSHLDTDGLTSAATLIYICEKLDKQFHLKIFKQLRPEIIEKIEREFTPREVIFTDFGSGQLKDIVSSLPHARRILILDHHLPNKIANSPPFNLVEVNPHYFGIDGDQEISSSGIAFLFAYTFSNRFSVNRLYPLALAGALGDSQVNSNGKLVGLNRKILKKAKEKEIVQEEDESLRLSGKGYKNLHKALATTFDPILPGISGSPDAAIEFLREQLGERGDLSKLQYSELKSSEKEELVEGLLKRVLFTSDGKEIEEVRNKLFTVTYLNKKENKARLKDLHDFSALLNACGRMDHPESGIRLALGERGKILEKAISLRKENREKVSKLLKKAMKKGKEKKGVFLVDASEWMQESFASIIASILSGLKRNVSVIAVFSASERDLLKLSLRVPKGQSKINLKNLVESCIQGIDRASGGGHKAAAGAYIPISSFDNFLSNLFSYLETYKSGT